MIQRSTIAAIALCMAAIVVTAPAAATTTRQGAPTKQQGTITEKQEAATEKQEKISPEKQGATTERQGITAEKQEVSAEKPSATDGYRISHGPYLQALTYDGVTVAFTSSARGFSRVEVRRRDDPRTVRTCVTVNDGLVEAWNTMNAIRIDSLEAATDYEYRIVSTRIEKFDPYDVRYGESVTTPWYAFRTPDPAARSFTFVAMNDIHDTPQKCRRLLEMQPLDRTQMVFYVGDMMNYFEREEQPYESFIDVSTDLFARHKPFAVVRGNHETRGRLARTYDRYIHNTPEGHYYGFYTFGDTAVVMLDCGEDKPDSHEVYAGLTAFDAYRLEQVEWLREVLRSREFRRARHRIVLLHIPPVDERMAPQDEALVGEMLQWHGNVHWGRILLPLLDDTRIDLMITAHQHSFHLLEPLRGVHDFPIIINDNRSALTVCCDGKGIHVRATDMDGTVKLDTLFK